MLHIDRKTITTRHRRGNDRSCYELIILVMPVRRNAGIDTGTSRSIYPSQDQTLPHARRVDIVLPMT
jgi:hypothetical protein